MTFPFLGLPREIRDFIYNAVFLSSEDVSFKEGGLEFTVSYGKHWGDDDYGHEEEVDRDNESEGQSGNDEIYDDDEDGDINAEEDAMKPEVTTVERQAEFNAEFLARAGLPGREDSDEGLQDGDEYEEVRAEEDASQSNEVDNLNLTSGDETIGHKPRDFWDEDDPPDPPIESPRRIGREVTLDANSVLESYNAEREARLRNKAVRLLSFTDDEPEDDESIDEWDNTPMLPHKDSQAIQRDRAVHLVHHYLRDEDYDESQDFEFQDGDSHDSHNTDHTMEHSRSAWLREYSAGILAKTPRSHASSPPSNPDDPSSEHEDIINCDDGGSAWETEPSSDNIPDSSSAAIIWGGLSDSKDHHWLLASKQILSEALAQFYRRAKIEYHTDLSIQSVYRSGRWRKWDYDRRRPEEVSHPVSVFSLSRITTLSLSLRLGAEAVERGEGVWYEKLVPESSSWSPASDYALTAFLRHIGSLDRSEMALKRLELSVWILQTEAEESHDDDSMDTNYKRESEYSTLGCFPELQGYEVDMSFLLGLGTCLESVRIDLQPTYMHTNEGGPEGNYIVVPMLQRELVRVAKAMVGGEFWVLEDMFRDNDAAYWQLEVKGGASGQQVEVLEHMGFKDFPGNNNQCEEETFALQADRGDGVVRWLGKDSGEEIEIEKPVVREERGDFVFQRSKVFVDG